jgi:hypothetical protein
MTCICEYLQGFGTSLVSCLDNILIHIAQMLLDKQIDSITSIQDNEYYTGCIKKLNRFEIALNFAKQQLVSSF